jgi:hypothetical protein
MCGIIPSGRPIKYFGPSAVQFQPQGEIRCSRSTARFVQARPVNIRQLIGLKGTECYGGVVEIVGAIPIYGRNGV